MLKTVYKLVSIRDGNFISFYRLNKFALGYKLGETTFPVIGLLFAYNSELDSEANKFLDNCALLKCEAEVSDVTLSKALDPLELISNDASFRLEMFWNNNLDKSRLYYSVNPKTVFCHSIKPLEVVWYSDIQWRD